MNEWHKINKCCYDADINDAHLIFDGCCACNKAVYELGTGFKLKK